VTPTEATMAQLEELFCAEREAEWVEFLAECDKVEAEVAHEISIAKFAEACGVTRKHMSAIVNGHAAITAEMAARMAAVLGTTAQYWLNLQNAVDLYDAQERLATSENRPQLLPVFG